MTDLGRRAVSSLQQLTSTEVGTHQSDLLAVGDPNRSAARASTRALHYRPAHPMPPGNLIGTAIVRDRIAAAETGAACRVIAGNQERRYCNSCKPPGRRGHNRPAAVGCTSAFLKISTSADRLLRLP